MSYRNPVEIKAEIEDRLVDLEAMAAHEEATVEGLEEIKASVEELKAELAKSERFETLRSEIVAEREAAAQAAVQPPVEVEEVKNEIEEETMKLPAVVATARSRHFASAEDAFVSGQAIRAMIGNSEARSFMNDLQTDGSNGESNTIPAPLSNALINLIEDYGVARGACKRVVMTQNTWDVPKLNGHVSINYTGEAQSISASDVSFGQVSLVAKKMTALSLVSSEMTEDSIISVMDVIVEDMARQIALEEDKNLFLGVNGGLLAEADAIKANSSIAEHGVTDIASLALSDLTALTVATGNPIVGARNEWWINPTMFHGPIRDLLLAAGGNTQSVIEGGQRPTLLGYPVNFVNVLPGASASAAGSPLAVFGDLSQGCYFGERRGLNFRVLNELYANTDQVGVQCTQRSALKVANPEVLARLVISA